jgi:hypothetical protein
MNNITIRLFPNDNPHEGNLVNFITKYANSLRYVSFSDSGSHPNIVGDISTVFRNQAELGQVIISNSKVSGDISNAFVGNVAITKINMRNTLVEGSIENLIRNLLQSNKAAFKARTDMIMVDFYDTPTTSQYGLKQFAFDLDFSGTSEVTLKGHSSHQTLGTYDIDTDTFTINS